MNAQIQVATQATASPPGSAPGPIEQSVFGVGAQELVGAQAEAEAQQQPSERVGRPAAGDDQPNGRKGQLSRHPQPDQVPLVIGGTRHRAGHDNQDHGRDSRTTATAHRLQAAQAAARGPRRPPLLAGGWAAGITDFSRYNGARHHRARYPSHSNLSGCGWPSGWAATVSGSLRPASCGSGSAVPSAAWRMPGGCLEDVPRDNHGHQRSTAVCPIRQHSQP